MYAKSFVLSGGGARGFAHVGAVQALREAGILPEAISATSAGALVGCFVANGFEPEEIRELFYNQVSLNTMLRWNSFRQGLLSLKEVGNFLKKNLRYHRFENLPIPLHVAATNFENGRQQIFSEGDLIEPVLAACSIPAVFPPVLIDDVPMVDGGFSNNLPIEPFQDYIWDVVAVYVNPIPAYHQKQSIPALLDRAFHLSFHERVLRASEQCYLYIEPPELARFGLFDANKLPEIYKIGYDFTRELLAGAPLHTP